MAQTVLSLKRKALHVMLGILSVLLLIQRGNAFEFKVGGPKGSWSVPNDPNVTSYNQWAEMNRFQIGDTLLFVYPADKDSVLQVTKDDYTNCNTASPIVKFSDGRTVVKFNQSGPYYFISGVVDNCLKNEKLTVIVMADRSNHSNQTVAPTPPPPSAEVPAPSPTGGESPTSGVDINPTPAPGQEFPTKNGGSPIVQSVIGSIGAFVSHRLRSLLVLLFYAERAIENNSWILRHWREKLYHQRRSSSPGGGIIAAGKDRGGKPPNPNTTFFPGELEEMAIRAMLAAVRNRSFTTAVAPRYRFLSTLVLAEHEGGSVKASSLSAVEATKSLGEDNSVSILLAGSGPSLQEAAAQAASCHPSVSQVLLADSDKFTYPLAEPWAKLLHVVQKKRNYSHIVAASDSFGKNILPRAAALLDVSPITDVIEISGSHLFVRPIYAGNALSTIQYTGSDPCVLTIRSTSFPVVLMSAHSITSPAAIEQVDLSTFSEDDAVGKSRYVKLSSQDTERPDLGNARIVVTGGRGLKSAENFKMIEKLAEKLGAAVGATRAAVDAGFVPNELQVGQTGKIVAPELYMAFGVSGAIQHLAGIRDSKVIVAINKDADAPIFQVADYGLVGDLFEVIPELLEKLPEKK
ncbi:Electron transfer flavoprotein subunit alpha [Abeliophyllum distichum]|uniref:Electron transfer flavoprotein subunit alpha, mitochondrial n=1 Tax=Abeliophyllum distichum TaxID=126358 RepID=A0ABD1PSH2_9LAMI